jgi:hypothetical protein
MRKKTMEKTAKILGFSADNDIFTVCNYRKQVEKSSEEKPESSEEIVKGSEQKRKSSDKVLVEHTGSTKSGTWIVKDKGGAADDSI